MKNCEGRSMAAVPTIRATTANILDTFKVEISGDLVVVTFPQAADLEWYEATDYSYSVEYYDNSDPPVFVGRQVISMVVSGEKRKLKLAMVSYTYEPIEPAYSLDTTYTSFSHPTMI